MNTMKLGVALLCGLFAFAAFSADQAALSSVKKVYLLPMGNSFDQYLANQLTMQNVFQVVTDPELADALLTDQIGLKFERQYEELYPPPEPEETNEDATDTEATGEQNSDTQEADTQEKPVAEVKTAEEQPRPISSFSRGKGNLFLVDRESRTVIWSNRYTPKDSSSKSLSKAATKVVAGLRESLGIQ